MISYQYNLPEKDQDELCNDKTIYRCMSVSLDASNLAEGTPIPKLCPIEVDYTTGKAVVCKRVTVLTETPEAAKVITIAKNGLFRVNDVIGNGVIAAVITNIDTKHKDHDKITVSLGVAISQGTVLHEAVSAVDASATNVATHMNYARRISTNGMGITPIGQVYEIEEKKLLVPVTAEDKAGLTSRFMFN